MSAALAPPLMNLFPLDYNSDLIQVIMTLTMNLATDLRTFLMFFGILTPNFLSEFRDVTGSEQAIRAAKEISSKIVKVFI